MHVPPEAARAVELPASTFLRGMEFPCTGEDLLREAARSGARLPRPLPDDFVGMRFDGRWRVQRLLDAVGGGLT